MAGRRRTHPVDFTTLGQTARTQDAEINREDAEYQAWLADDVASGGGARLAMSPHRSVSLVGGPMDGQIIRLEVIGRTLKVPGDETGVYVFASTGFTDDLVYRWEDRP